MMISKQEYNLLQKAKRNVEYLDMLEHFMEEAKAGSKMLPGSIKR